MHGDIGMGLIVALIVCKYFGVEETWIHAVVGVMSALWLDIDGIFELFTEGRIAAHAGQPKDHRHGLHYPLIVLSGGFLILYPFAGPVYTTIWFVATFLHFAHDSFGTGWGIRWLYPFSTLSYKFFTDEQNQYSKRNSKLRFVVGWNPAKLKMYIMMYGVPNWFEMYLRSWFFWGETVVCAVGIALTVYHFTT